MYIGIDLGGTNIAAGIVREDGKIVVQSSVPTLSHCKGYGIFVKTAYKGCGA